MTILFITAYKILRLIICIHSHLTALEAAQLMQIECQSISYYSEQHYSKAAYIKSFLACISSAIHACMTPSSLNITSLNDSFGVYTPWVHSRIHAAGFAVSHFWRQRTQHYS